MERVAARARVELKEHERFYRGTRPPLEVGDRGVILVDDGLATGASMPRRIGALLK